MPGKAKLRPVSMAEIRRKSAPAPDMRHFRVSVDGVHHDYAEPHKGGHLYRGKDGRMIHLTKQHCAHLMGGGTLTAPELGLVGHSPGIVSGHFKPAAERDASVKKAVESLIVIVRPGRKVAE